LDENMLKGALDRRQATLDAKQRGEQTPVHGPAWVGESMCLQVEGKFLDVAMRLFEDEYQRAMRRRSWGNVYILNEWKRLYPDRDPLEVHEELFKTRLICPGGGEYVWDREWLTMGSTVYGHPGAMKEGPAWPPAVKGLLSGNLGVTFEDDGLRARAVVKRKAR
jgi:hypothetical protein